MYMHSSEYFETKKIIFSLTIHTLPCHGGEDSVQHGIHF